MSARTAVEVLLPPAEMVPAAEQPAPDWQKPPRIAAVTVAARQRMMGPPESARMVAASSTAGP